MKKKYTITVGGRFTHTIYGVEGEDREEALAIAINGLRKSMGVSSNTTVESLETITSPELREYRVYRVRVTETGASRDVEVAVFAETPEEAERAAVRMYSSGEVNDLVTVQAPGKITTEVL